MVQAMDLKLSLVRMKRKQKELIPELKKRGLVVAQSELSSTLAGELTTPKAERILTLSREIIKEWERSE